MGDNFSGGNDSYACDIKDKNIGRISNILNFGGTVTDEVLTYCSIVIRVWWVSNHYLSTAGIAVLIDFP